MTKDKVFYQFPTNFCGVLLHQDLKVKESSQVMEKDRTTGIIGIVLSLNDFITKLALVKHQHFTNIMKRY